MVIFYVFMYVIALIFTSKHLLLVVDEEDKDGSHHEDGELKSIFFDHENNQYTNLTAHSLYSISIVGY